MDPLRWRIVARRGWHLRMISLAVLVWGMTVFFKVTWQFLSEKVNFRFKLPSFDLVSEPKLPSKEFRLPPLSQQTVASYDYRLLYAWPVRLQPVVSNNMQILSFSAICVTLFEGKLRQAVPCLLRRELPNVPHVSWNVLELQFVCTICCIDVHAISLLESSME